MNSCLEQRNEPFDACLNKFWVNPNELGLGFVERGEERTNGRKRKSRANEWTGLDPLLYKHANRVNPNPVHFLSLPIVWSRSRWIWINPTLL